MIASLLVVCIAAADGQTAPTSTPASIANAAPRESAAPPIGVRVDSGVDLPFAGRVPMASTRVDLRLEIPLGGALLGAAGARVGYSYAVAEETASDVQLGVDQHALVMLHQIPIEGVLAVGLRAPSIPVANTPARLWLYGAAGGEVVFGSTRSFGRTLAEAGFAPAVTGGAAFDVEMGPSIRLGLFGEADVVHATLASAGINGDLGAVRVGVAATFAFGS